MSFEEFLKADAPAAGASAPLAALWHDAHGDWERAHICVQDDSSREGAWVHAYLHRREGDDSNARYWYARAGRTPPAKNVTLDAERVAIGEALSK
ncbi:MAG: hypothetical protein JWM35_2249 [Verrucomicrobia bacterium]|nr:hypothetical protein [Verrucomicrobiota bacterium]